VTNRVFGVRLKMLKSPRCASIGASRRSLLVNIEGRLGPLLLSGSMNLNCNPRFEQLDITEDGEDFDLVERIEGELPVLGRKRSNAEAKAASGVSNAFEASQLEMFRGLKVRNK
jgi:hypothetical protein